MNVNEHQLNSFLEAVPRIISDQDNDALMKPFTLEEIWKIVQSLPPDKAPGLDGFTTLFFQKCWDVLVWDLLMALESSRRKGYMCGNFNSTNISIIPKSGDP